MIDFRLHAGPSFASRWLIPRLGTLYALLPDLQLHVIGTRDYFDPAELDFGLAVAFTQHPASSLHKEVLLQEYLTPICSPEYLAGNRFLKTPADLASWTLLYHSDTWPSTAHDGEWSLWLHEVGAQSINASQRLFFSLPNLAIESALAHQGIAMGRMCLIQELLAQGTLVSPLPSAVKTPGRYYLVYHHDFPGRRGAQAMIEWLREEATKLRPARELSFWACR